MLTGCISLVRKTALVCDLFKASIPQMKLSCAFIHDARATISGG